MNTRTLKSLDLSKFVPVPAPDLMEIIEKTAPGKDGINILYSLAGGLEFRIARLAAMVTNVMASYVRQGDVDRPAIDKMNDALAALNEAETRVWAFNLAGISQVDMVDDLKDLIHFHNTVRDRLNTLLPKPVASRWYDTIAKAAEPQPVEEWKLGLSWDEYVEGCHGKTEMTEEEFKKVKAVELGGTKQNWTDYTAQIIDTIERFSDDEADFDDISVDIQKQLLESISNADRELKFRSNAMKMAKSPEDLHARRMLISSFCTEARLALTHSRYAEKGEILGATRISEKSMADANTEAIDA